MVPTRSLSLVLLVLGTVGLLAGGCSAAEPPPPALVSPGAGAYDRDIHCADDAGCNKGESCTNGLCQMKRCASQGLAKSVSPIRSTGFMILDRELIVADGLEVVGFDSDSDASTFSFASEARWNLGGGIVDLASGSLNGSRPETFVVAKEGSASLTLKQGNKTLPPIALGFVPIAVATGDTHQDGIDHIVATNAAGTFAICNAKTNACEKLSLGTGGVTDVAVGDVDGDGYSEVLFLVGTKVVVYHHDHGGGGTRQPTTTSSVGRNFTRITSGDLDGDGVDELIGLEDGADKDIVHVMTLVEGSFTVKSSTNVLNGTLDLAVGGLGGAVGLGGEVLHVVTIGAGNAIEVLDGKEDGTLAYGYKTTLTSAASRVAFSDLDGNSVPAALIAPPKVVSGSLVPLAVLTPPPYSKTHSGEGNGDARSTITVESAASKGEGQDSSFTLSVGAGISVGFSLGPVVNAGVGVHVGRAWTKSHGANRSTTVSQSFSFEARPDLDGFETGAVALGCGCFDQYDYQIDDPRGLLAKGAAASGKVSIFIPIGGQTALWSLKRYNQLAAALKGELPTILTSQKAGDLSSYPTTVRSLTGKAIPKEDMLFSNPPSFHISDVATINFALGMGAGTAEGAAISSNASANANIGAFGVTLSGDVGVGVGDGYSVSVSKSTTFIGNVPPVRDRASTPEDEFAIYGYSFTPIVYREHYVTREKKDAGYFVVTYAVGP